MCKLILIWYFLRIINLGLDIRFSMYSGCNVRINSVIVFIVRYLDYGGIPKKLISIITFLLLFFCVSLITSIVLTVCVIFSQYLYSFQ